MVLRGLLLRHVWSAVRIPSHRYSSQVAGSGRVDKALLSKLRKQTGIPFINCKKALAKFDNNFDEAKQWLLAEAQKEGWARATKLQSRPMSQGLVAVIGNDRQATMLEVNCETDFVAKNAKFISMVTKLVQDCNNHFEQQSENKVLMGKSELGELASSEKMALKDVVALNVGNLGENMALRRAVFMKASELSTLAYYVHPSSTQKSPKKLLLGKYGALVEMRVTSPGEGSVMSLGDIGSHLCQHIVGMNPQYIGQYQPRSANNSGQDDKPPASELESEAKESTSESGDVEEGGTENVKEEEEEVNEDALLQQEFLLDTSMTVGELLCMNNVEVLDFKRFACGEELPGESVE